MDGYETYYDDLNEDQEAYPLVRAMLGEAYDEAGPEEIERLFYDLYGEAFTPQDMEFAWGALISAIPAVVSAVGSVAQLIGKATKKRRTSRPAPRRPASRPAPRPRPAPARPARAPATPQVQAVAGQLMNTLMNPQFLNALMSVVSGLTQRGTVRTSRGESVPLEEYTTALAVLAEDFQEALALEFGEDESAAGYFAAEGIDPLIAEDRASLIQEIIAEDNEAFLTDFEELLEEAGWVYA